MNVRVAAVFLCLLTLPTSSVADPSPQISKMMDTSASVLDLFMLQIEDRAPCTHSYFHGLVDDPLCIWGAEYDFTDNLVTITMMVGEKHPKMASFKLAAEKGRQAILGEILHQAAAAIGVESYRADLEPYGIIQQISIRRGWSTKDFDEKAARKEFASRTVIQLQATVGDYIYTGTRNQHGEVSFKRESITEILQTPQKR